MAGRDFAIVELNGVTSEATHIYDPTLALRRLADADGAVVARLRHRRRQPRAAASAGRPLDSRACAGLAPPVGASPVRLDRDRHDPRAG